MPGIRTIPSRRAHFGSAPTSFTGPLDIGGAAKVAYSVGRKLRAAYTGAVIRVRRSSDSTEQDFYAGADGSVSVADVQTFCGAGDGLITTLYDQSGNGYDLTQATASRQPVVVLAGVPYTKNGKLAMYHTRLSATSVNRGSTEAYFGYLHDSAKHSWHLVIDLGADAASKILIGTRNASLDKSWQIQFTASEIMQHIVENGTSSVMNSSKTTAGVLTYNTHFATCDLSNGTVALRDEYYKDGTLSDQNNVLTNAPVSGTPTRPFIIGANSSGSTANAYLGYFCEFISWGSDMGASRAAILANSKSFWGTP